jgi:hypothetical protein
MNKTLITFCGALVASVFSANVQADWSANLGWASEYIFRVTGPRVRTFTN